MRQKHKEISKDIKSHYSHVMCVVAAGNHGFGFRLPSPVMELLGSLFTVWLLYCWRPRPSAAERYRPISTELFYEALRYRYHKECIQDKAAYCLCTQSLPSHLWHNTAHFHCCVILNGLKWVQSNKAFCKFYCANNILPCVRNNLDELQRKWRASKHFTIPA